MSIIPYLVVQSTKITKSSTYMLSKIDIQVNNNSMLSIKNGEL